ncbi:acetate--CoA ligase family protein, partial [Cellulomonas marina]
ARYARRRAEDRGRPVAPPGVDVRAARRLVRAWSASDGAPVALDAARTATLLSAVGIGVVPAVPARDAEEAVRAARAMGYPVALKTTVPALRHRADLGGVRLDLEDDDEVRAAAAALAAVTQGQRPAVDEAPLEVQAMVEQGVSCVLRSTEDPLFGPVLSFGVAGDATDLLGDVALAMPPLTDADVAAFVRSPRAAARLYGYRGSPALDAAALEDLVARVSLLADGLPELRSLELNPVVVTLDGVRVLGARAGIGPADRSDAPARALGR